MILRRTAGLASSTVKRSLACSTEACTARLSRDAAAAGAIVAASGQYHRLPKIPSSTCTFIQRRHISSSGPASATSAPLEVNNGTTRRPLHLVILGAPGAGKGTQTDSILRRYDVRALVVGNLLRDEVSKKTELGLRAASVMKAGGLLDDQTILEVVKPGLKQLNGTNWILVGLIVLASGNKGAPWSSSLRDSNGCVRENAGCDALTSVLSANRCLTLRLRLDVSFPGRIPSHAGAGARPRQCARGMEREHQPRRESRCARRGTD